MNINNLSELLQIKDIVAPNLTDPNYGDNIREQFQNIDDNFKKLVGRDYFKGEQGDSVDLIEVNVSDYPDLIEYIRSAIYDNYDKSGLTPVSTFDNEVINWDDNLIGERAGKMLIMYTDNKIISSLAYIYADPRFGNKLNQLSSNNDYSNLIDTSSVVYFDKYVENTPKFKVVNLFPTLYYDVDLEQFCWKIWGSKTGIIVGGSCNSSGSSSDLKYIVVKETNIINI